jgi:hypothetical protein
VCELSESTLTITFTTSLLLTEQDLHHHRNTSRRSSFFSLSPETHTLEEGDEHEVGDFLVELLVAPCPAATLVDLFHDRLHSSEIRQDLIRLFNTASPLINTSSGMMVTRQQQFRPSLNMLRMSIGLLNRCLEVIVNDSKPPAPRTNPASVAPTKRPCLLEINTQHVSSLTIRMRLYIALLIQKCSLVREKQFPSLTTLQLHEELCREFKESTQLTSSPSSSFFPSSSLSPESQWVTVLKSWEADEVKRIDSSQVITILNSTLLSCLQQIQILILCGLPIDHINDHTQTSLVSCLEDTLSTHFKTLFQILHFFLNTEKNFQKLMGQRNQTNLIKYLLLNDFLFANSSLPFLSLFGVEYSPTATPLLLGAQGLKELVRLYSKGLVHETRMWLSKTITHSKRYKEKNELLPWDLEKMSGGLVISTLPETLRFQLNQYTLLLSNEPSSSQLSPSSSSLLLPISPTVSSPPSPLPFPIYNFSSSLTNTSSTTTMAYTATEIQQIEKEIIQLSGLPEQILRAICKSFSLLAQEYMLTLQSKHWEIINSPSVMTEGGGGDDSSHVSVISSQSLTEIDHMNFLISICNDCYRVATLHLPELLRLESIQDWSSNTKELIHTVHHEFQEVSEYSLKCLTRLIFRDLQETMIHFDKLWFKVDLNSISTISARAVRGIRTLATSSTSTNTSVSPIQVILTTIEDYLSDIEDHLIPPLYINLIISCAEICVIRYLLFLKELSCDGHVLNGTNLTHLQMDVIFLIDEFKSFQTRSSHSPHNHDHPLNPVTRTLNLLADVIAIIATTSTDDNLVLTLQRLFYSALPPADMKLKTTNPPTTTTTDGSGSGAGTSVAREALECFLSLRLDCRNDVFHSVNEKRQELIRQAMLPLCADSSVLRIVGAAHPLLSKVFSKKSDDHHATSTTSHFFHKMFPTSLIGSGTSSASGGGSGHSLTKSFNILPTKKSARGAAELQRNLGLMDRQRRHSHDYSEETTPVPFNTASTPDSPGFRTSTELYTVRIQRVEAKSLLTKAVFGSTNPYVVITLGSQRQKLPVQWNTSHPKWLTEELVYERVPLGARGQGGGGGGGQRLDIRVYDKERLARKTLLGAVTIPIDGIDLHPIESWFALSGGVLGGNGEIYLEVRSSASRQSQSKRG